MRPLGVPSEIPTRRRRLGIDTLVLERDDAIGGTWARRDDCLHLHTIPEFSGLRTF